MVATTPHSETDTLSDLLARLGPLPVSGRAWSRPVCLVAWAVLALIGVRLLLTATSPAGQAVAPGVAATLVVCYSALIALVFTMGRSVTRISAEGIEQSGLSRKTVRWADLQSARFVPLPASARLICFVGWRRPVTFQAGTPALKTAFAHIALTRYPLK